MRLSSHQSPAAAVVLLGFGVLSGCAVPAPYSPPAPAPVQVPPAPQSAGSVPEVETLPAPPPEIPPAAEPLPPAPVRERTLNPAATTLVAQAQTQAAAGNYAVAAANLERALRIEPDSAQIWLEMGRLRQAEGNYPQAENMARKALSLATGDRRSQADAWRLIADSYRARKRVQEAREADVRAEALMPN